MKPKVLDNIVLELGLDQVLSRLHIDPDSEDAVWVEQMVKEARQIARPKVIYAPFDIDEKGDDYVVIGGSALRVGFCELTWIVPIASLRTWLPVVGSCRSGWNPSMIC